MTGLEIGAALLVLSALKGKPAPSSPPPPPPSGGGSDLGKAAAGLVGVGATIATGIVGGGGATGGTAAAGGTTAGVSAAEGSTSAADAGVAAGETAGFVAEGLTIGAAVAVAGFFVLIDLVIVFSSIALQAVDAGIQWSLAHTKLRENCFSGFWQYEEQCIEQFVAQNGGTVLMSEFDDPSGAHQLGADGWEYNLQQSYYPHAVTGVTSQQVQDVRAVARWFAIQAEFCANEGRRAFAQAHGTVLLPGDFNRDTNGQVTQPLTFIPGSEGKSPAMLTDDYWRLAANYLATQPLATRPGNTTGYQTLTQRLSGPLNIIGGYDGFQFPGPLPYRDLASLSVAVQRIVGNDAFTKLGIQAAVIGWANALALAAAVAYNNTLWPGDERFVRELASQCGVPSSYVPEVVTVVHYDNPPAGTAPTVVGRDAPRWMLREQQLGYAIDVVGSRERGQKVVYPSGVLA